MTRKSSLTTLLVIFLLCLAIPIGLYSLVSLPFSPPAADSPQGKLPPLPVIPTSEQTEGTAPSTSSVGLRPAGQDAAAIIADFRARHANDGKPEAKAGSFRYTRDAFSGLPYSNKELAWDLYEISEAVLEGAEPPETLLKLFRCQSPKVRRTLLKVFGDATIAPPPYDAVSEEERLWSKLSKQDRDTILTVAAETIIHEAKHTPSRKSNYVFWVLADLNGGQALLPPIVWAADNNRSADMRIQMTNLAVTFAPESPEVNALIARRYFDRSADVRLYAIWATATRYISEILE